PRHRAGRRRLHGDDRNARSAPADRAAGLCGAGAAARLSCGRPERHRRRPAAQPRQERDGGMNTEPHHQSGELTYSISDIVALNLLIWPFWLTLVAVCTV